tara:strand:- start:83 stop:244 length:162 start_codon:yes stop_codon:yes gene_type:complete
VIFFIRIIFVKYIILKIEKLLSEEHSYGLDFLLAQRPAIAMMGKTIRPQSSLP